MTTTTRLRGRTGLALSLVVALLLAISAQRARADSNPNPGILPPNSHAFGLTNGGWSAASWQYVGSIPVPNNPLFDQTGANCGMGQSGPVWFLVGLFNAPGTATRSRTIPAGKALFFPILNGAFCCGTIGQIRALGQRTLHDDTNLSAAVDGTAIPGLSTPVTIYLALSPVFTLTLPDNNIFGLPAGSYSPIVSDGIYLMLAPLPAGPHTVHFAGSSPGFSLDITYRLAITS
ncbi:MAG: hypothetical protein JWO59_3411 [Chloroflexi bacterium]|nr:hypothetical protein [Chloroflexota bacterium]